MRDRCQSGWAALTTGPFGASPGLKLFPGNCWQLWRSSSVPGAEQPLREPNMSNLKPGELVVIAAGEGSVFYLFRTWKIKQLLIAVQQGKLGGLLPPTGDMPCM